MSLTKTDLKGIKGIVIEATGELESKMDKKLDGLETRMDQKFNALGESTDKKLDSLESRIDKKLGAFESGVDHRFISLESSLVSKITASEQRTHKLIKSEILNLRTEIVNKLDHNYLTRYDAAEYEERFRMIKFRIDELDSDVRKLKGKAAQA